jgi:DNA-binding SARP family transcriptional activator
MDDRTTVLFEEGCYRLVLPAGAWVDCEAARSALDRAEGALREGNPRRAWGDAGVSTAITRRDLLPGADTRLFEEARTRWEGLRLRALECFAGVLILLGETPLASSVLEDIITRDPYRESAYASLMRLQVSSGNRARALVTFDRCRRLLADDLGVDPSPQTAAVYLEALRA